MILGNVDPRVDACACQRRGHVEHVGQQGLAPEHCCYLGPAGLADKCEEGAQVGERLACADCDASKPASGRLADVDEADVEEAEASPIDVKSIAGTALIEARVAIPLPAPVRLSGVISLIECLSHFQ